MVNLQKIGSRRWGVMMPLNHPLRLPNLPLGGNHHARQRRPQGDGDVVEPFTNSGHPDWPEPRTGPAVAPTPPAHFGVPGRRRSHLVVVVISRQGLAQNPEVAACQQGDEACTRRGALRSTRRPACPCVSLAYRSHNASIPARPRAARCRTTEKGPCLATEGPEAGIRRGFRGGSLARDGRRLVRAIPGEVLKETIRLSNAQ